MLSKLFSSRRAPAGPVASLPAGQRVYAIGDIHGRLDLLEALLTQIEQDDRSRGASDTRFIFLGDLIDRGPHSAQVIDRVMRFRRDHPATTILFGNHEEVFTRALEGELESLKLFIRIGGRETILSYGISENAYRDADFPQLIEMLRDAVPAEHTTFLEEFEDLVVLGDYAFVHAGVRPGEPLTRQRPSDLRWIRREFLEHRGTLEKVVVHGHSISDEVEQLPHRIGLDTGAYSSNILSAMGFEGSERWVLQAKL